MVLPTVVGRSKDGTFKYVRESSSGKVVGWKGQGLSKAISEVLVKSDLQATPTFTMSFFQFNPKNVSELDFHSSKKFGEQQMVNIRCIGWLGKKCVQARKRSNGI